MREEEKNNKERQREYEKRKENTCIYNLSTPSYSKKEVVKITRAREREIEKNQIGGKKYIL